jgi:hypothetical protein
MVQVFSLLMTILWVPLLRIKEIIFERVRRWIYLSNCLNCFFLFIYYILYEIILIGRSFQGKIIPNLPFNKGKNIDLSVDKVGYPNLQLNVE